MSNFRVLLVKPPATTFDIARIAHGQTKRAVLTEEGILEAGRLGAQLRLLSPRPAAIYSSDIARGQQAAQIIAKIYGIQAGGAGAKIPMVNDKRLRETDLGELEGKPLTSPEYIRYEKALAFGVDPAAIFKEKPPERPEKVLERITDFFKSLASKGGEYIVVGHKGPNSLLVASLRLPDFSIRRYIDRKNEFEQKKRNINVISWDGRNLLLESTIKAELRKLDIGQRDSEEQ